MNSQLDDVNALLRIPGLDKSRLKHIKKTLEEGNMLYVSDSKFLREQTKEHLENYEGEKLSKYNSADWPELSDRQKTTSSPKTKPETENSFCGNCGKRTKNENFCTKCGHALNPNEQEIESSATKFEESKESSFKNKKYIKKGLSEKKKLVIVFVVLPLLLFSMVLGNIVELPEINSLLLEVEEIEKTEVEPNPTSTPNSKCGAGTVFDEAKNTCILG